MPERITWKSVREKSFPKLVDMAAQAGLDPRGWEFTYEDTPMLVVSDGMRLCRWSTARECDAYMQAWVDALAIVATEREPLTRVTDDDS